MSTSVLQKYLTKLLVGKHTVAQVAEALNLTVEEVTPIYEGKTHITTQQAIALAKLTGTDPAVLLHKQTEAELADAGVNVVPAPVLKEKRTRTDGTPARTPAIGMRRCPIGMSR